MYGIFSRSTENEIPNKVKHFVRHSNLEVVIILSQEFFFSADPDHFGLCSVYF